MRERIYLLARDRTRRWNLAHVAGCGDLEMSWTRPGGSDEASWRVDLPPDAEHPALRRGRLVEIQHGPDVIWVGHLIQAGPGQDRSEGWTLRAQGTHRVGRRRPCLDALGNTTTTPDVAITQAIAEGLQWNLPTSISAVPFEPSDSTKALNTIGDLLDAYCEQNGLRWWVGTDWGVRVGPDPTTPTYYMTPGSGAPALADDEFASDVYVRYQEDALTYKTAHASNQAALDAYDYEAALVDAVRRGLMTSSDADDLAANLLALGKARLAWTAPVEPASRQLTRGGIATYLPYVGPEVGAGIMVRLKGINDPLTPDPWTDFVVGKAQYSSGSDSIPLTPMELAARNLRDAMEKMVTTWNPRSAA